MYAEVCTLVNILLLEKVQIIEKKNLSLSQKIAKKFGVV